MAKGIVFQPQGSDPMSGSQVGLFAGTTAGSNEAWWRRSDGTLIDLSAGGTGRFPTNYIQGFEVWSGRESADFEDVMVQPGSCRNRDDTADIAHTTERTCDIALGHGAGNGLPQSDGLDEIGLDNLASGSITCSQALKVITASASILSPTPGDNRYTPWLPKNLVVASSIGTAVTAAAGADLPETLAVGDLWGNGTLGWSRITVVGKLTLTLVAALPGGNMTNAAWSYIPNATIWPGTATSDKQRIDTLSAAGTIITVGVSKTITGPAALTIGNRLAEDVVADNELWLAIWVRTGDNTVIASTQHIHPLADNTETWRRVGWVLDEGEFEGDDLSPVVYEDAGRRRKALYGRNSGTVAPSNTGSWVGTVVGTFGNIPAVPRTARFALTSLNGTSVAGSSTFYRRRLEGGNAGAFGVSRGLQTVIAAGTGVVQEFEMPVDGAGYFESKGTGTATIAISTYGWVDVLGFNIVPVPA